MAANILSASSLLLSNSTSSMNQISDSTEACSYLASGSRDKTVKLWDPLKVIDIFILCIFLY
jgi:WD40 repeat protein